MFSYGAGLLIVWMTRNKNENLALVSTNTILFCTLVTISKSMINKTCFRHVQLKDKTEARKKIVLHSVSDTSCNIIFYSNYYPTKSCDYWISWKVLQSQFMVDSWTKHRHSFWSVTAKLLMCTWNIFMRLFWCFENQSS